MPAAGGAVVFATWEEDPVEMDRRLMEIHHDGDAPWVTPERISRLHLVDMAGDGPVWGPKPGTHVATVAGITAAGERLRRYAETKDARLLVIDPLAAAYASDENARGLVRAFCSNWDAWGRTVYNPADWERCLIRCMTRILAMYEAIYSWDPVNLGRSLGLPLDGRNVSAFTHPNTPSDEMEAAIGVSLFIYASLKGDDRTTKSSFSLDPGLDAAANAGGPQRPDDEADNPRQVGDGEPRGPSRR